MDIENNIIVKVYQISVEQKKPIMLFWAVLIRKVSYAIRGT